MHLKICLVYLSHEFVLSFFFCRVLPANLLAFLLCEFILKLTLLFLELFFHFLNVSGDGALKQQVLKNVHEDLLEDHDDYQILLQALPVLVIEDIHEDVGVGVDELEHVRLVDDGVLLALQVLVVLFLYQVVAKFAVDDSEY